MTSATLNIPATNKPFPQFSRPKSHWTAVLLILLLAFVLRLVCTLAFTGTIDTEGAEYARIAENVLKGNGYTGIATEGPQLLFPPLYPLSIAALSLIIGDAEMAGRTLSLMMGSLLVIPVFFIALHMYGVMVARTAAILVATHPLLIRYSATVYCEATYMTLLAFAVLAAVLVSRHASLRILLALGVILGLAYLVRPEALMIMVLVSILLAISQVVVHRESVVSVVGRFSIIPVTFIVIALPNVIWLYEQTGTPRFEGKIPVNFSIVKAIEEGHGPETQFGVDSDLTERGIWLKPNLATINTTNIDFSELLEYAVRKSNDVVEHAVRVFAGDSAYGSPPLFAFAFLGLFAAPWNRELTLFQLIFLSIFAVCVAATIFIYYQSVRFYLTSLPFACIWAAAGIAAVAQWAAGTVMAWSRDMKWRAVARALAVAVSVAIVIACSASVELRDFAAFDSDMVAIRHAGEWLRENAAEPLNVVDTTAELAFHAGAAFTPFPMCDESTAMRFFDKRGVSHIVLRENQTDKRPYLKIWSLSGIPSRQAKLVHRDQTKDGATFAIYQWTPSNTSQPANK